MKAYVVIVSGNEEAFGVFRNKKKIKKALKKDGLKKSDVASITRYTVDNSDADIKYDIRL